MFEVTCVESFIDSDKLHYGCFKIEPLEFGQALTVANTLRRILLSELIGIAITSVRINNVRHEFSSISGVREDVLDIILNLKQLRFRSTKFVQSRAYLSVTGPLIVTADKLILPNHFELINDNQYLATVNEASTLEVELKLDAGVGYCFANQDKTFDYDDNFLTIDANFSPIKRVNFRIRLLHLADDTVKEALFFEIWTDGSITPSRSLKEATKLTLKLFSPLLLDYRT